MLNVLKQIAKYICTFLGVIAFFNLCLYLVCCFDSDRIYANALESSATMTAQGRYPYLCYPLDIKNDSVTDALMLNELASVDSTNPLESYMKVRKNFRRGQTTNAVLDQVGDGISAIVDEATGVETVDCQVYNPIKELHQFVHGINHSALNYGRYWHGYLTFYRPMLALFNVTQMRYCLLATFIGLYAWLLPLLYRRFGSAVALIFGSSLLSSGYFSAHYSLQCAPVFLVMMISSIILLRRLDKIGDFGLFIFVVGCFANYVDYLTVPLVTLGVLSNIYLLKLNEEGRDWAYCVKALLGWSCLWVLGYAATWFSKWALYDLIINDGQSMIGVGLQQCLVRTGRSTNLVSAFGQNYILITLICLGKATLFIMLTEAKVLALNRWTYNIRGFKKQAWPFLLLATYPPIWLLVLANHTIFHYFFTYRLCIVYMIGILLALRTLDTSPDHSELLTPPSVSPDHSEPLTAVSPSNEPSEP